MAIQVRRGNISDLDKGKLLPGEYACAMDKKRVFLQFGTTQETVLEMPTKENYEEMLKEVSDSAQQAQSAAKDAKTATEKVQELLEHEEDIRKQIQEFSNEAQNSADEALQYKKDSEENVLIAAGHADNAALSAADAGKSEEGAGQSEQNAKASEESSAASAKEAAHSALMAKSYSSGETGIREGEDTDCAKYYKEKAEEAAVRAEQVSDISFATQEKAGIVKPDGITITVDEDGTLHGANTVEVDGKTIEKTEDNVLKIADALKKLIDNSVQKVTGKDLSTNDFTDALLKKLNSIEEGAQVNPVPINNQLATVPGSPLDAVQGKELRNLIDNEVSRIEENMADLRDMDEDLEDQIDNLSDGILNKVYPVGSVYISFNNNSPANFIGGTWERITDTFLYAATSKISERGGSATSTLSVNELPKHKHDIPVLTGSAEESGSHSHKYGSSNDLAAPGNTHGTAFQANGYDTGAAGAHTHSVKTNESNTGETGNGRPFSIMPPYINVYMWKRID